MRTCRLAMVEEEEWTALGPIFVRKQSAAGGCEQPGWVHDRGSSGGPGGKKELERGTHPQKNNRRGLNQTRSGWYGWMGTMVCKGSPIRVSSTHSVAPVEIQHQDSLSTNAYAWLATGMRFSPIFIYLILVFGRWRHCSRPGPDVSWRHGHYYGMRTHCKLQTLNSACSAKSLGSSMTKEHHTYTIAYLGPGTCGECCERASTEAQCTYSTAQQHCRRGREHDVTEYGLAPSIPDSVSKD